MITRGYELVGDVDGAEAILEAFGYLVVKVDAFCSDPVFGEYCI